MVSRKRTDLSRRLTQPLVIPGFMTLATLSDVRTLLDHLPAGHVEKAIWHHVADRLDDAARGAAGTARKDSGQSRHRDRG